MDVLALSSSRAGNGGFLETALPLIGEFTGPRSLRIAFLPFASVQREYTEYGAMVAQALAGLPHSVRTVTPEDARQVLETADLIMVGGGNTFKLLHDIYTYDLFDLIRHKVRGGTPYIGWSAGANITGRSIGTTNDMPIIQPLSFTALGFFPFQINPHYLSQKPEGHHGETRDQRIEEFVVLNPGIPVVGLPEGTALRLQGRALRFTGDRDGVLFESAAGQVPQKRMIRKDEDLSALL